MSRERNGVRPGAVALVALALGAGAVQATDIEGVWGGLRYDNWWIAAGLPEPVGDHPLYPPAGQQSGPTTWRCKECHGWDYKGVDGAYASGPHYTGIVGVLGSTLAPSQMFDLIKNHHGYGAAGLPDQDISYIVEFLQDYLIDTDFYIDGAGQFFGDTDNGRYNYLAYNDYYNCARCHGPDAPGIIDVAKDNPWEFLHKVRVGQPGVSMTSWILAGAPTSGAADIGAYLQADLPAPAYAGEASCQSCHADSPTAGFFDAYTRSAHRWIISRTAGQQPSPGFWPHTPVPPLPVVGGVQLTWADVEYVIGNFFWKTQFVDRDGFIYTGDTGETTQWNIATQRWVPFNDGEIDKPYDCGRCHTTGYNPEGNQHGLPGLIGTWGEDGVRCEACHGPSADHVAHPNDLPPPGGTSCAECHSRDPLDRMQWRDGFMLGHQQAEDLAHSPHARYDCTACHDPHRSVVYREGGIHTGCSSCHPGDESNNFYVVQEMESVDCIDCHMPYMARSAEALTPLRGDLRAHLFRITRGPILAANNVYPVGTDLFWKVNNRGQGFVTLDYACLACHEQIGEPLTLQEASAAATNIHARAFVPPECVADINADGATDIFDFGILAANFGTTGHDPNTNGDLDGDGDVDVFDFGILAADFGCPG